MKKKTMAMMVMTCTVSFGFRNNGIGDAFHSRNISSNVDDVINRKSLSLSEDSSSPCKRDESLANLCWLHDICLHVQIDVHGKDNCLLFPVVLLFHKQSNNLHVFLKFGVFHFLQLLFQCVL